MEDHRSGYKAMTEDDKHNAALKRITRPKIWWTKLNSKSSCRLVRNRFRPLSVSLDTDQKSPWSRNSWWLNTFQILRNLLPLEPTLMLVFLSPKWFPGIPVNWLIKLKLIVQWFVRNRPCRSSSLARWCFQNGDVTRQEAVSMIPPMLLDINPEHVVLTFVLPWIQDFQLLEAFTWEMCTWRIPYWSHHCQWLEQGSRLHAFPSSETFWFSCFDGLQPWRFLLPESLLEHWNQRTFRIRPYSGWCSLHWWWNYA